jgi:hypothetical protein
MSYVLVIHYLAINNALIAKCYLHPTFAAEKYLPPQAIDT